MQSIELLLDRRGDSAIRSEWNSLHDAGLPSQGGLTTESNAPHITLLAAERVDVPQLDPLPLPLELTGLVVFGALPSRLVLARLVVMTDALLTLHRFVHLSASGISNLSAHTAPNRWTPHVTLARRMTPRKLAQACELLGMSSLSAVAASARHWDGDTLTVTRLGVA